MIPPLHRDNFVKLVNQKFYDSLMFHRIIPDFMIRGRSDEQECNCGQYAGHVAAVIWRGSRGIPLSAFLIKPEGAGRGPADGNPEKPAAPPVLYRGRKGVQRQRTGYDPAAEIKFSPCPEQRQFTKPLAAPFLDQDYTVFGEVVSGLEVIGQRSSTYPRMPITARWVMCA